VDGSCECGTEPLGFMKGWEVLEYLHNWQISIAHLPGVSCVTK
jgi:hypothetical protein